MIEVVGLGYIGLPTALILASHGNDVTGVDKNLQLVQDLQEGRLNTTESGLDELFVSAQEAGIRFAGEHISADMYIIAVPTPYIKSDKRIDPTYVIKAFEEVCDAAEKGAIVILESTVSPGTIEHYVKPVAEKKGLVIGEDIYLTHAPERIIPGKIIYELKHNARTIGADEAEIGQKVKELYSSFCQGEIVVTDIRTAEMTKVVENTYRDINIAFANELAKICRAGEMDVYKIIEIANKHPRVNILNPGPGVGGHCISVDPWFLVGDYPGLANLILAARKINDSMPEFVLERIAEIMEENGIKDISEVGLYGLTYKEDVDDVRESPTLQMLDCMKRHLASGIKVYDPLVKQDIVAGQYHDLKTFLNDIKIVVIMIGHLEIKDKFELFKDKIVLDTRNIYPAEDVYRL